MNATFQREIQRPASIHEPRNKFKDKGRRGAAKKGEARLSLWLLAQKLAAS
uniref:Uncharacterized protein n=1 Tax=Setaria italica TaxID=4555 RepID=K3YXN5_SETIT